MTQSLTLVVTDAGRAALVNAQNTGTDPVLVANVGLTAQAFTAAATTAALPGELKQLTTFAGGAVAADTIHVSIHDDSADTYSLRGFALYLADGTLFASYGQADPIGEKSAQSMLLLAADIIFADIDATALIFGDTDFLLSAATTEQQGIIELATEAEAEAGTDATRAMTPATHKGATDARLGAGAPSTFIKTLLVAASAAATRAVLGIKSAATFDTGTGKGLDADTVDGQHATAFATAAQGAKADSAVQTSTLDARARWLPVNNSATLVPATRVIPVNTVGAIALSLPANPADGDTIEWRQGETSFALNSVTILRNGRTIMGLAEDMLIDTPAACGSLVWRQSLDTWRVYATATAGISA